MTTRYLVQHRRGTSAQWAEKNTIIPKAGEIVIEIDEVNSLHKLKIGDGVHPYSELSYLQAGDEIITQVFAKTLPRVVTVELTRDWVLDADGRYKQILPLDNITKYSRLDLQPDIYMLDEFRSLNLVFTTENINGVIVVYSIGNMPSTSYMMQATIIETETEEYCDKVVGIPVNFPPKASDQGTSFVVEYDAVQYNGPAYTSGVSSDFARADHIHGLPQGVAFRNQSNIFYSDPSFDAPYQYFRNPIIMLEDTYIQLTNDPTEDLHASTKHYVDTQINSCKNEFNEAIGNINSVLSSIVFVAEEESE